MKAARSSVEHDSGLRTLRLRFYKRVNIACRSTIQVRVKHNQHQRLLMKVANWLRRVPSWICRAVMRLIRMACKWKVAMTGSFVVSTFLLTLYVLENFPQTGSFNRILLRVCSATPYNQSACNHSEDVQALDASLGNSTDGKFVKLGSRLKSIVFIKAFKVGGTTMSSLLTAYALNTNQVMASIDNWCTGGKFLHKNGHCVDMIGGNHPTKRPCAFRSVQSDSFCKEAELFMFIREPISRLWSGFKHEVHNKGGGFLPLETYMNSNTIVKVSSHEILGRTVPEAVERAGKINILLHHLYDESLVYMAAKTGMKLCDIMYAPCDRGATWDASKCSLSDIEPTPEDVKKLHQLANATGELLFYNSVVKEAEKRINTTVIRSLTDKYRTMRAAALKHCSKPEIVKAVESYLALRPYVKQDTKTREKLFHLEPERTNPLDAFTLCLGWFCMEKS